MRAREGRRGERGIDAHGSREEREHVARNDGEGRDEHLEAQGKRVERGRDVRGHAERHEHREELAEIARRPEHGLDEPADVPVRVAVLPFGDEGHGDGNCCAEALDEDLRELGQTR